MNRARRPFCRLLSVDTDGTRSDALQLGELLGLVRRTSRRAGKSARQVAINGAPAEEFMFYAARRAANGTWPDKLLVYGGPKH